MQAPTYLVIIKGIYYAQVRVPSDIIKTYRRKQHKESLRTKDYSEACRKLHAAVVAIRRKFDEHRAQIKTHSEVKVAKPAQMPAPTPQSFADLGRQYGREISEQALTIRADLYEAAVANPKEFWRGAAQRYSAHDEFTYFDKIMADGDLDRVVGYVIRETTKARIADLKRAVDTGDVGELLELAEQRQPGLDRKAHVALALTLARAEIAALQSALSGDLEGRLTTPEQSPASASIPPSTAPALAPISLDALFDKWKAETKPAASTLSTWRGVIRSLKATFPTKADDAGSLTPEDMIKWKDDLVATGLAAKTINASYLACIRTVFNFGVANRLVKDNPGNGVKMSTGKKSKGAKTRFGYTNAGAARLLELAKQETNPRLRWLPWLAAQTGSRIGEVAQLWGSFVKEEAGIHYLDLKPAPDGGTFKEDVSERTVPIHPQLIADGFLEFVKSKGDGPLFYGKSSGNPEKKHASVGAASRVREWVRANGFNDKRIDPNHGLRHWFKTYASSDAIGVSDRLIDRIQGHAYATEAGGYYDPDLSELLTALKKIKLPPVSAGAEVSEG
ncbi:DUF6538 domain-containing protein [Mesorhizobium sp. M0965]|uniref:DUF6538 domain-containing protein n=1 Tax=Mesorhizobium sp. M0965 TaxID=2957036 RepID=UPI00333D6478